MKTTIFILVFAAFLQTTIFPFNFVLIILICRSFLNPGKSNLFLAFIFGLLTAHLTLINLGFQSIIFLAVVQITQMISKLRFSTRFFLILPLTFILLCINAVIVSFINHGSVQIFPKILIESMFSIPIFYLSKLWEERFIVQKSIKLRF